MVSCTNVLRRRILTAGAGSALATAMGPLSLAFGAAEQPLQTRPIPHSGEQLPIVGIGTRMAFEFENDPAQFDERRRVLQTMISGGAKLVDTAHSYSTAEDRVGVLIADLGARDKLFIATKFSFNQDRAAATASMQRSLQRLKVSRVDLIQAWNVSEANYDFGMLRDWKQQGLCRYVGMTTSFIKAYDPISKVLAREKPDFFQVNYSIGDREAERVLLPLARDVGAAVMVNLPFGRNSLFKKAGGRPLPDLAKEIGAASWAQFFLKFILSHPAVTAVIPGTDKPEYMVDNMNAGRGVLPDAAMRKRMIDYWDALS